MEYLSNNLSRRVFVKGLGCVSTGLLLGTLGGCEKLAEAIRNRPTRRWLHTSSAAVDADIATYRQAVTLMKALPASDPRSWNNQAAIHGSAAGGFNFCQHGTDHFFDWHRAYLFYFEKICQKLTGNAQFGLPYWNWNQTPDIHSAFLDTASSLYLHRTRTSMTGSPATTTAALDPILADTNFFTFRIQLEGTPHNTVHTYIDDTMGGGGSALDPIFWNHHCMVDYCWAKWNLELGNDNTNDSTWIGTVDEHFVDADGNPASTTAGITTLMPLISYQYESSAIGSSAATAAITTRSAYQRLERRIREGANIRFEVKTRIHLADREAMSVARPVSRETKLSPGDVAAIIENDAAKEHIFLAVEYAELPAASDFAVRVFLNLPNANRNTPIDDPHYAGSFAFFGTALPAASAGQASQHHHELKFLVSLTNTLQKLKSIGALSNNSLISVQLVAVPFGEKFEREETELSLQKIEIITTPVIINSSRQ